MDVKRILPALNKKRIRKAPLLRGTLCSLLVALLPLLAAAQENRLNRISASERSDGMGHVIRFHLSQEADSFMVFQPEADLIQMALYGQDLDTSDVEMDGIREVFDEVSLHRIPSGIGVDVYIPRERTYRADAYPDRGSEDLLLAFTESSAGEVREMAEGRQPVIWSRATVRTENLLARDDSSDLPLDETYEQMKDKIKFDRVVIDAGHGGWEPGSVGYRGIKEKDITLAIARKIGEYIRQSEQMKEVEVIFTREDDSYVELEERGSIANQAEGDLFVSIHCNASASRQAHGTESYFLGMARSESALETMKRENSVVNMENGENREELTSEELLTYELLNSGYIASSEKLAGMMQDQFKNRAQRRSRGVKQAGFIVLYHASMPAVLIETGFISNPSEARYLTTDYGQSIVASAIFRAIRNYKVEYENNQHFTINEE